VTATVVGSASLRTTLRLLHLQTWPATRLSYRLLMISGCIAAFFCDRAALDAGATLTLPSLSRRPRCAPLAAAQSEGDRYVEAARVATDADVVVSALRARPLSLRSSTIRPTAGRGYLRIPLAEGQCVDTSKMVIGERIVGRRHRDRRMRGAL